MGLEFGILGPLTVVRDGKELVISGARRRALLVRLLVSANELVPAPQLAEDLWNGEPPPGAASTLQSHISFLRRTLDPGRLVGRDGGYLIRVTPSEFDVARFDDSLRRGRGAVADGDHRRALSAFSAALDLWRGAAMADVRGASWALPEETRLTELRLGALESQLETLTELGEDSDVVALAERALAEQPLRETLWSLLMLALYRSGRQADALRAYQRLRRLLADELGIEPSAELAALDDAILRHDPALDRFGAERAPRTEDADALPPLPRGAVTLLFTDIEGSTSMWERDRDAMGKALDRHHELVRQAIEASGGVVFNVVGDGFCAAFSSPGDAVSAAAHAQRSVGEETWVTDTPIRVRMALHSGVLEPIGRDYRGPVVNRVARLMQAGHGGQILVSAATRDLVHDMLPAGTGLQSMGEHRLRDLGRPAPIFQLDVQGLPSEFLPLRTLDNPGLRHNLPVQLSTFIGRTSLLDTTRAHLGVHRLVTLIGAGGVGKTRLALQVAADMVGVVPDGVWLVELASLVDTESIARALAKALGVPGHSDRPTSETIATFLRDREVLVLLDNCEHVVGDVARLVAPLLAQCPKLTVLATAREPLNVAGEATLRVPPLELPDPGATDLETIAAAEAVRLFCDRAASHQPHFLLDSGNCTTVSLVCRRLDGIPLAIELAATRLRSLSVDDVNQRLDRRFRLLTGGDRASLPRQQTLRATVDWSYDLLTEEEQRVFCRLSVLAGSWTLDAGTDVGSFGDSDAWAVEESIDSLVDKNLVQADPIGDVVHYRLLETMRAYASERLDERGEQEVTAARAAHARHFLTVAEEAAPHLTGPDQVLRIASLEADHDNLRESMGILLASDQSPEIALRLGIALRWFWFTRGYFGEGIDFVAAALDRAGEVDAALRGPALLVLGTLASARSEHERARDTLNESIVLARNVSSTLVEADGLCELSFLCYQLGERDEALEHVNTAISLARGEGDGSILGFALSVRSSIIFFDDRDQAHRDSEEAITLLEQAGDRKRLSGTLCRLGLLELEAGAFDEASRHLQHVRALALELDDGGLLPFIHFGLGFCALFGHEEIGSARAFFGDSLLSAIRVEDGASGAYAVLGLAFCAVAEGDPRAASLHGLAAGLLEHHGEELDTLEKSRQVEEHERLRHELGEADFEVAFGAGVRAAHDGALHMALAYAVEVTDSGPVHTPA